MKKRRGEQRKLTAFPNINRVLQPQSISLRSALDDVIGKFTHADKLRTKELLTNLIDKFPGNGKLISKCNWHLNNVNKLITISNDMPWNLNETISFLKAHKV